MKTLDEHVQEMRRFGEYLMAYNFPHGTPTDEDDLNILKARQVLIDGYSVILHYSKADYTNYRLETLQVLGTYSPFLPFCMVCKVAKKFLGDKFLSLVELLKDNRKIYCWNKVLDRQGQAVAEGFGMNVENRIYEGFHYRSVSAKQVNFH